MQILRLSLLTLVIAAVAAGETPKFRTDENKDGSLRWYQPEPGKFAPEKLAHSIEGELIQMDALEREFVLRVDRNDSQQRSHWDLPLGLSMLPYGSISYQGSPAALRDIPYGTHLHVLAYAKDEDQVENPMGVEYFDRISPESEFRHCIRVEDDFSFRARKRQIWQVDAVDLEKKKLTATLRAKGESVEGKARVFDLLGSTRVFEGDGFGTLDSLKAGQLVQFNLTWVGQYGPGRIREIWIDEAAQKLATSQQLEIHRLNIRERGMPGWVDAVDDEKQIVTITFFDGVDPTLFDDFEKINPEPLGWPTSGGAKDDLAPKGTIAVARECLMTFDPTNDRKGGNIVATEKVPVQLGCSGVQIQVQCGMLLEGYRPTKIVRFFPAIWPFVTIPKEEQFHGRE